MKLRTSLAVVVAMLAVPVAANAATLTIDQAQLPKSGLYLTVSGTYSCQLPWTPLYDYSSVGIYIEQLKAPRKPENLVRGDASFKPTCDGVMYPYTLNVFPYPAKNLSGATWARGWAKAQGTVALTAYDENWAQFNEFTQFGPQDLRIN